MGLPDENGEEVMWSREIVTGWNVECVINKTCVVTGRENVVIVDEYWLIDDKGTEVYNIAWLYESDGDQNGNDIEEGGGGVTDDSREEEDGDEGEDRVDEEEEEDGEEGEDEAVVVKMLHVSSVGHNSAIYHLALREVGLSGCLLYTSDADDE